MTLYGWDLPTWHRAIEWSGVKNLAVTDITNERLWPRFAAVRCSWLNAGGPMSGPSSDITVNSIA